MTDAEQITAFIKTHGVTKASAGVSGRDLDFGAAERASERERETFAGYAASGNRAQYLDDRNFEISRRRR